MLYFPPVEVSPYFTYDKKRPNRILATKTIFVRRISPQCKCLRTLRKDGLTASAPLP